MKEFEAGGGAAGGAAREYDVSQFDSLAERYEKLNWRMVSKPGGATVRPDDFYRCAGPGWWAGWLAGWGRGGGAGWSIWVGGLVSSPQTCRHCPRHPAHGTAPTPSPPRPPGS